MTTTVAFENDRVKVSRVKHGGHELQSAHRRDRLIVYLDEGTVVRAEGGKTETIKRKAGDVSWRGASTHEVENAGDRQHEVLIVEFK